MAQCSEGSEDSRHDYSIVPVDVSANATLIFKICSYCGTSYRYTDQIWEEIATEEIVQ